MLGETKGGSETQKKREEEKGRERTGKKTKRKGGGEGGGRKERHTKTEYLILRFKNTRKKEHHTLDEEQPNPN